MNRWSDSVQRDSTADDLSAFGFDEGDAWLDCLRRAETDIPYGYLGDYRLLGEVGRGAQGVVFRAEQPGTNRVVALKRVRAGGFATAAMRRRFEREIEALAALDHPHIVRVLAVDVVEQVPVLAMEWVDGRPVTDWAKGRSTRDIVAVMVKVCDAVLHAHRRGVIHRDLKPTNILVDTRDEPHVLDFGLATATDAPPAGRSATTTHDFVGTLLYAAPEQVLEGSRAVDVRSDVYALGVVLYELLVGRRPFEADGPAGLIQALQRDEVPAAARRRGRVDRDLEAILLKALSRRKEDRYGSVAELATDLRSHPCGGPLLARPRSRWRRLRHVVRQHRVAATFATTVFVLVAGAAIVAAVLAVRLAAERDAAEAARARQAGMADFLENVLVMTDPVAGLPPETPVRKLLDEATRRIDAGGLLPPDRVAARVLIGRAYANLGAYGPAEEQLRAAVRSWEAAGAEPVEGVDALFELVMVLHVTRQAEEAARTADRAVSLVRALLERGSLPADLELTGLCGDLAMRGKWAEAEDLYAHVLKDRRARLGPRHPAVAATLTEYGSFLTAGDRHDEAEALLREAVEIRRASGRRTTPGLATALMNLAMALHGADKFREAETRYVEALEIRRALLGENHPLVAQTLFNYSWLLRNRQRLAEATTVLREAAGIYRDLYGPSSRQAARVRAELGRVLHARDFAAEAAEHLRGALEVFGRLRPPGDPAVAALERDLAACLSAARASEGASAPSRP